MFTFEYVLVYDFVFRNYVCQHEFRNMSCQKFVEQKPAEAIWKSTRSKMFCVVILQAKIKLVVPIQWVQSKEERVPTKIFFSSDRSATPNFNLRCCYFMQKQPACYNGFVLRVYGE